ncbi:TPA: Hsp20/alpha crystallin family protein [Candidatus Scatousia excrementigallinarum]|uniref:Hsp20/alpha crystallin family protein n=1 Tax=Candidatus Scatousia excrementigallinarum TaxID=2840935 RepID=A0A9D1F0J8_9BACT|nr:Hsp20/alpha crystallin family protein [Candidatus Scatousia excrementigallinarum]
MKNEIMIREPELYFDSIHQELNNFLRDTFLTNAFANPLNIKKSSVWRPAIEVKQNDNNYKVKVQLPGIKKDNINIELDNDFMTITAETHEEKEEKKEEEKNERYHTSEFRYGKYVRTISFDQPIKADDAKAKYKDGVLTITIPKQQIETNTKKVIKINEDEE